MAGPLSGRKVVELAGIGPVPFAGMMLADLGADVVRVDRPGGGALSGLSRLDPSGRGRRSVALDLKRPEGVKVVERLVRRSDIFIEGFRPGVVERLRLGPDRCLDLNPSLVYGRMTGWGQEGPLASTAGHDINYLARTGTLSAIGSEREPIPPLNLVADYGGGAMFLLVGVLAALDNAVRTGQGQVVDAAMVDGVALLSSIVRGGLAAGWWEDRRHSNLLDGAAPFYRTYRTSDARFLAVGALEPEFYSAWLSGVGLAGEDLPAQYDRDGWPILTARFGEVIASRPLADWMDVFAGSDACVAPVHSLVEALDDFHLRSRGVFVEAAGLIQPAPAPRFSATPSETDGIVVEAGAHTEEVLEELGYSNADIGKLIRDSATQDVI
ncbi:MAG TPA: CaiB/BaiF CoA-transferase family protein [Acidimicrobiia bacterium]|nr:CaiB/BaiF CoA-transferase family protein [Acidimicrobiia bacterium]